MFSGKGTAFFAFTGCLPKIGYIEIDGLSVGHAKTLPCATQDRTHERLVGIRGGSMDAAHRKENKKYRINFTLPIQQKDCACSVQKQARAFQMGYLVPNAA